MIAYWHPGVGPEVAKEHPDLRRIQHAGPWCYVPHPQGGCLAFWGDWPEDGRRASHDPAAYADPVETVDALRYCAPKVLPDLYELARGETPGCDVVLACGRTISVPLALAGHRQFRLGGSQRYGDPISEYGRLAMQVMDAANESDEHGHSRGISHDDPRLIRLLELAIGSRYRVTRELIDDLGILAVEDIDALLGAIWVGDPKALAPARAGAGSPSGSSASSTATSASPKPATSSPGASSPAASPRDSTTEAPA